MLSLFNFYKNAHGIKTVLSTFVSHNDFWFQNKELKTPAEINGFSRQVLAERFIDKRTYQGKYSIHTFYEPWIEVSDSELNQHLIEYIDLVIPRHYFVLLEEQKRQGVVDRSEYRKKYIGISQVPGLIFQYEDNYERELELLMPKRNEISRYKLFHLEKLSDSTLFEELQSDAKNYGFVLKKSRESLSRREMISLISYFREDVAIARFFDFVDYE